MNQRAVWAGVAIRLEDGSVVTYELEAPRIELSVSYEGRNRVEFLTRALQGLPPVDGARVSVQIEGVGRRTWREGATVMPEQKELGQSQKMIEGAVSDEQR